MFGNTSKKHPIILPCLGITHILWNQPEDGFKSLSNRWDISKLNDQPGLRTWLFKITSLKKIYISTFNQTEKKTSEILPVVVPLVFCMINIEYNFWWFDVGNSGCDFLPSHFTPESILPVSVLLLSSLRFISLLRQPNHSTITSIPSLWVTLMQANSIEENTLLGTP